MKNTIYFIDPSILFCLLSLVFTLSCNNQRKLTSYIKPFKEINQKVTPTVIKDVSFLFIVDTSISMDDKQMALGENLERFLNPLFQTFPFYKYNFAFTTMERSMTYENKDLLVLLEEGDCELDDNSFKTNTDIGPYLSYLKEDFKNHSIKNLVCILSNNVQNPSHGSANESYFQSLERIVEESKHEELFQSAFFGEDSLLILIFLSDASDGDLYKIVNWKGQETQATKRALEPIAALLETGLKPKNIRPYIIVPDFDKADGCGESNSAPPNTSPYHYPFHAYEFVRELEGLRFSICKEDWGTDLKAIFEDLKNSFQSNIINLGEVPQLSSLQVLFNGKVVPNDAINGWSYNPETVSIIISEDFDKLPYLNSETKGDENLFTIRYNAVNIELLNVE